MVARENRDCKLEFQSNSEARLKERKRGPSLRSDSQSFPPMTQKMDSSAPSFVHVTIFDEIPLQIIKVISDFNKYKM